MANLFSFRSGSALTVVALAAVIIGCGGGGGNDNNGSNGDSGGGTNPTTGTTASNPATTSGSAGTLPGGLPQDSVFYAVSTTTDPSSPTYDLRYVKPDGASETYQSGIVAAASPASPDPSQAGRFVFVAIPAGGTKYGIYRNTTASINGATTVAPASYGEIRSVQISRDGAKVIFIAAATEGGSSQLYSVNADGTGLAALDVADTANLSMDGTKVVYSKFVEAEGDSELFVRFLNEATSTRLTSNNLLDESPQFSKDGTRIVFTQTLPEPSFREQLAFINLSSGAPYSVQTIDPVPTSDYQRAPSFNSAGDRVSFVVFSSEAGQSGLWTARTNGTDPRQLVASDLLEFATYWTTPQGRSLGGSAFGWSPARRR